MASVGAPRMRRRVTLAVYPVIDDIFRFTKRFWSAPDGYDVRVREKYVGKEHVSNRCESHPITLRHYLLKAVNALLTANRR